MQSPCRAESLVRTVGGSGEGTASCAELFKDHEVLPTFFLKFSVVLFKLTRTCLNPALHDHRRHFILPVTRALYYS